MKVFFRNVHLYLSLAAGLVIMIACLTGAILVFEKELQMAANKSRYYVAVSGTPRPLEELVAKVRQQYPEAKLATVKVYSDPERTAEVGLSFPDKGKDNGKASASEAAAPKAAGKPAPQGGGRASHTAFINPYTAEIAELYTYRETFFYKVFALHRWLLGSSDGIGKYIVGVATFLFMFITITGIILWWPKTRRILVQRLKIKQDAGWKRLNHDLHIVLGFYASIFLFIFSFTAMSWSFKWFNKGLYKVTRSSPESPAPPESQYQSGMASISYDDAYRIAMEKVSNAVSYQLRSPKDSSDVFTVTVLPQGKIENATDTYYLDQYSGDVAGTLRFDEKNLGQRVRSYVKPVHVGSVFGTTSKVISFIVCVLGVTFPVTGVVMWLNRLKKERRRSA